LPKKSPRMVDDSQGVDSTRHAKVGIFNEKNSAQKARKWGNHRGLFEGVEEFGGAER